MKDSTKDTILLIIALIVAILCIVAGIFLIYIAINGFYAVNAARKIGINVKPSTGTYISVISGPILTVIGIVATVISIVLLVTPNKK